MSIADHPKLIEYNKFQLDAMDECSERVAKILNEYQFPAATAIGILESLKINTCVKHILKEQKEDVKPTI